MRRGYYTRYKLPKRKSEQRIKIPQPVKRPLRFQLRSIIKKEYLQKSPWWFIMHRRGVRGRPVIGVDPLEARAAPRSLIRGTLPERILYAALVQQLHMIPDVDFVFQSSLQGGRIGFGGLVVDFQFPHMALIIQVQGPTHTEFLRMKKDVEQTLSLEEMGYTVVSVDEDIIYDELKFDSWLKQTFGWVSSGGGASYEHMSLEDAQLVSDIMIKADTIEKELLQYADLG